MSPSLLILIVLKPSIGARFILARYSDSSFFIELRNTLTTKIRPNKNSRPLSLTCFNLELPGTDQENRNGNSNFTEE